MLKSSVTNAVIIMNAESQSNLSADSNIASPPIPNRLLFEDHDFGSMDAVYVLLIGSM